MCLGNPLKSWKSVLCWIFGVGPFGWQVLTEKELFKYGGRNWLTPHNEFVHLVCEHGLLGLFASMALIVWTMNPSHISGDSYGVSYISVMGVLIGTALWSFPWRGTALVEGQTGRFIQRGKLKTEDGEEKNVLVPEIQYATAGAPIFTWITAIWFVLGPNMG